MSCPALTNKGGKLYISDQPVDCDLTLSELAVLDYVFVPGVGSIGDTGVDQDVVTYPTTDAGLTAQGKGDAVARNWDIEVLEAQSQARDILDEASAIGNDDNYATRIEWPNGDVEFSIVQVASRTAIKGAASGVRVIRYTMVPSFIPIVTNSLPVASNVVVSGTYFVGDTLTATYDYYSPLGLPESGSTYQWYADGVVIPGADGLAYVIDEEYEGQMISFGVEPSDGASFGPEAISSAGGPVLFTPEILFEGGDYGGGLWYAKRLINGTQNLYQDAAGTIPVVADGDPVGLVLDRSGNLNHLAQSDDDARPIYRTDGTSEWLMPDGIDDFMVTAGSVDMKGSAESTMFCATEIPPTGIPGRMLELGPNETTNRTAMFYVKTPDRTMYRHGGSVIVDVSTANSDYGKNRVSSGRASIATPISEQYFDGVLKNSSTATQGSGVISNNLAYLMATSAGAAPLSVPFFGAMLISRYLNDDQMTHVNNYFEGLLPPPSPIVIDDNVTYELDTNDASGWVDEDADDPVTVVSGALVFNNGEKSNSWTKTITGPASGDYIFITKLSSTNQGGVGTVSLGLVNGQNFRVSLGYDWTVPGPELSRVSAQIGSTGFLGPLIATAGNIVEVAIQYDSRVGVGNFFVRESGEWKFYGGAAIPSPYDNNFRVGSGGSPANSIITVHEAFFCKPNFVSIGDSISKGATLFSPDPADYPGIDNYDSTWMAHCNIYPELRNNLIVDYGIGGQSSAQINSRMNSMLTATNPRIVFIHASTNDYGDSVPFTTRTANIQASVDKIVAAGAYAVMLNAVYSNAGHPDWPAHADYAIEWWTDYRDQITGTWALVDIMGDSGILDGSYMNVIYTQSDGVHPNPAGYTLIGQTVALTDLPDSEAP